MTSIHYEVVDGADRTLGDARFTRAHDAHALREALLGTPGAGRIAVAEVTERVVVERQVVRLPHRLCPGRP